MYALLVDNNLITASGLKGIVERFEGDAETVSCLSAPSLLSVAERLKPDVIIYDFSLIGNDLDYYTQTIREQNAGAYILAIVKTDHFETLYRAIEENFIDDYIIKPVSHSDLLARLRIAAKNRAVLEHEVEQPVEEVEFKQQDEDFAVTTVIQEEKDLETGFESALKPGEEVDVISFDQESKNEGEEKEDDWDKLFDPPTLNSSLADEAVDTQSASSLFEDDETEKKPEAETAEDGEGEAESLSDWFDLGDLNGDTVEDRVEIEDQMTPAPGQKEMEPLLEPDTSLIDEPAKLDEDSTDPEELEEKIDLDQNQDITIFKEPDLPGEDQLFADQQASSGPVLFEEPEAQSEEPRYSPVVSPTTHPVDPQGFEDLFGPRSEQVDSIQNKQPEQILEAELAEQPEFILEPPLDKQPDFAFAPTWDKQPEPEADQPQFDFSVGEVLSADNADIELSSPPFMDEPDLALNRGVGEDENYDGIQQQYDNQPPAKKTGNHLFNIQDPQNEIGKYFPGIGFEDQQSERAFTEEPLVSGEPEIKAQQGQESYQSESRAAKRKSSGSSISRVLSIFGNILFGLLLFMMVALSFFLIQSRVTGDVPNVFGYQMYIVLSGSMSPEFDTGSLAFVRETDPAELAVGDIITYRSAPGSDSLTTHRIVEVRNGSDLRFVTRGDANTVNDPSPVQAENVVGRVTGSVPYMGYVMDFAQTRQGLILLIFVPGVLIIIFELGKILRYLTQKDNQEGGKEKEKITDRAESF